MSDPESRIGQARRLSREFIYGGDEPYAPAVPSFVRLLAAHREEVEREILGDFTTHKPKAEGYYWFMSSSHPKQVVLIKYQGQDPFGARELRCRIGAEWWPLDEVEEGAWRKVAE